MVQFVSKVRAWQKASLRGASRTSLFLVLLLILPLLISACAPAAAPAAEAPAAADAPTTEAEAEATEAPAEAAAEGETIKVGILHSLSGTMSISEVSVKDATLLAIEEINAKGLVVGQVIELII